MKLKRLVYVIAGEASGDSIGGKLIHGLQKHKDGPFEFRGVGGPQMTNAGKFNSLFPMHELSVMGLTEIIPKIFLFRRRIRHVVDDIAQVKPDAIVTIDSKGFCFRVLNAINVEHKELRQTTAVVHYVAPSIWAYRHKYKQAESTTLSLQKLMDRMLVILPFEAPLFKTAQNWATFVGHPAVEDFLVKRQLLRAHLINRAPRNPIGLPQNMWLTSKDSIDVLNTKTQIFQEALSSSRDAQTRSKTFTICAFLGSRDNEAMKSVEIVKESIELLKATEHLIDVKVIFPTILSMQPLLHELLQGWAIPWTIEVEPKAKQRLLEASDVSIAVSGTVVIESVLAGVPTVVIYRANRVTELLAKALARINFVSIPNIMMERELIPELVFSKCTSKNLTKALSKYMKHPSEPFSDELLSVSLSQLVSWKVDDNFITPERASELAANAIAEELMKKIQAK